MRAGRRCTAHRSSGWARRPVVEFAKSELDLPVGMWTFLIGFVVQYRYHGAGEEDLGRALGACSRISRAPRTSWARRSRSPASSRARCSTHLLVLDSTYLRLGSVVRWFTTCVNQPEFVAMLGETKLMSEANPPTAEAPAKEKRRQGEDGREEGRRREEEGSRRGPGEGAREAGEEGGQGGRQEGRRDRGVDMVRHAAPPPPPPPPPPPKLPPPLQAGRLLLHHDRVAAALNCSRWR